LYLQFCVATDTIGTQKYQGNIADDGDKNDPYTQLDPEKKPPTPSEERHVLDDDGNEARRPTEEEHLTLRRISGKIPSIAYWICAVEFAERASYYGVQPLFNNYVNKKMPAGGNGYGAPKVGTQDTAGALGLGPSAATAVSQSFSMLVYSFPVFWGWLADSKTGRYSIICWGVAICGISHVLMVSAGAPTLLQSHKAVVPFMLSVYILAIGAGMESRYCRFLTTTNPN
jgi:dipeptide/tripeptide permease